MRKLAFLFLTLPAITFAQRPLNLTLFGGFANYSGDLQSKRVTTDQAHGAFGAGLSYELSSRFIIRGTLVRGKISGDDKKNITSLRPRNLNFESRIYDASLVADYSFVDLDTKKLTPYVFAGLAIYHFSPYTRDSTGAIVNLRPLGTEGQGLAAYPDRKPYKLFQISVPFGFGLRFRINETTTLGYEFGIRKTFTDYLDDVSTTYADPALLLAGNGPKALELAYRRDELKDGHEQYPNGATRGGEEFKDWYYFSGITLSFRIWDGNGRLFGRGEGKGSVDCPRRVL